CMTFARMCSLVGLGTFSLFPSQECCMVYRLSAAGILAVCVTFSAHAQSAAVAPAPQPALTPVQVPTPLYDSAYYAWQSGNYPDALQRFEKMLSGPKASEVLEPIALVTGALYVTIEVAPE